MLAWGGETPYGRTSQRRSTHTTLVSRVLWFPDRKIASGDWIIIYSKVGSRSEREDAGGATTHIFYWGSNEPLWKDPRHVAVLLHVDRWKAIRPPEPESDSDPKS